MGKKALRKDFYMEIRRSLGRFLSIFFIVAIGVAFFSWIRSSELDMRFSGDAYFDKKNLMDIEVISTMGLTDDDVSAIEAVDGIEKAEGGYSVDAQIQTFLINKDVDAFLAKFDKDWQRYNRDIIREVQEYNEEHGTDE